MSRVFGARAQGVELVRETVGLGKPISRREAMGLLGVLSSIMVLGCGHRSTSGLDGGVDSRLTYDGRLDGRIVTPDGIITPDGKPVQDSKTDGVVSKLIDDFPVDGSTYCSFLKGNWIGINGFDKNYGVKNHVLYGEGTGSMPGLNILSFAGTNGLDISAYQFIQLEVKVIGLYPEVKVEVFDDDPQLPASLKAWDFMPVGSSFTTIKLDLNSPKRANFLRQFQVMASGLNLTGRLELRNVVIF